MNSEAPLAEQDMTPLDPVEARVLGALIEKEATTPEYYPLSMNALLNACNQKSNREPVVDYDEITVSDALSGLRARRLTTLVTGSGRVDKYAQRFSETWNLGRRELAVLCVLLLRGPQTLGEIKDRSERLFAFPDLSEAERILEKLSQWPSFPLVRKLGKQSGQKEARFVQLLTGEPSDNLAVSHQATLGPSDVDRFGDLEAEVRQLRDELQRLKERFDRLESELR